MNAQNPGHDGGAKLRSRQRGTRNNVGLCSAVVRSLIFPEAATLTGASACLRALSTMLRMVPLPRFAGEDHGVIAPQRILTRLRGRGTVRRTVEGARYLSPR